MDNVNTNNDYDRQLLNERRSMKEIDILLERWIPVNTIIREEVRAAIVKEIDKAYKTGYETAHDEARQINYKINTITNG